MGIAVTMHIPDWGNQVRYVPPAPGSSLLPVQVLGGSSEGSTNWVPATHTGGLHRVPGSWHQPQPDAMVGT